MRKHEVSNAKPKTYSHNSERREPRRTKVLKWYSKKQDNVEVFGKRRSSYKEHTENALASGDEEGRGKLRKAVISRKQAMSHRYPNGETRHSNTVALCTE